MSRSNTPSSLDRWKRDAQGNPHRASVPGDICWASNRPSPDLIACARVVRGGRMILAFRDIAVRDYFVESYADHGARTEPDLAVVPVARKGNPTAFRPPLSTLKEAMAAYSACMTRCDAAEKDIERLFVETAQQMATAGNTSGALSLVKTIPGESIMKTIGISRLMEMGALIKDSGDFAAARSIELEGERAIAVLEWSRADRDLKLADKELAAIALPEAKAVLERDGLEALKEFSRTVRSFEFQTAVHGIIWKADRDQELSGPPSP